MPDERMTAALSQLWLQYLSETKQRLHVLQHAADHLARTRTIEPEIRGEAVATAHALASALGMFGLRDAVAHARDVEATLDHDGLPQPERLQEQVRALRVSLQPHLEAAD